ncbi:DUF4145 domain-containing protein [Hymenobacter yonginensis]|uniref:DUF4145 domain-containing protein n=1 Tax=Hymenobacter yonginensis TaxID=748197 RepID=A0ABY7PLP2_9BACT|nr:DUF4145 domain-containing protein [Hymenobacter yonginensis]WBO83611.1 DUF4145 domain-containing protein [Hymenobacter yonginensis]
MSTTPVTLSCGHCSNVSFMPIVGNVQDFEERGDATHGYDEHGEVYTVLKCPACFKINIASYYWSESMEPDEVVRYEQLYPQEKNIPIGLPDNILRALKAAEKVKTIDAHVYAFSLGRTLELVCMDRNAQGNTLAEMLKDLADKHEIPEKLVDVAKGLRQLRNVGAHAGLGNLSESDLPIAQALCYALLEYIYSAPHLAAQAEIALAKIRASH